MTPSPSFWHRLRAVLRRLFARSLPEVAPSDVLSTTRAMLKGGDVVVLWRRIVTNYRPA